MPDSAEVHVILLAAGKGTRMNSDRAKVLHRAAGRTLLGWALAGLTEIRAKRTIVVVGHRADEVVAQLPPAAEHVVQEPQNGTGHAAKAALDHAGGIDADATIVVAYADMPLVEAATYRALAERPSGVDLLMATVDPGPDGFGRIVRDGTGRVVAIVEEGDASPDQVGISERNPGLYAFRAGALAAALDELGTDNAQGEMYLTDAVAAIVSGGGLIETFRASPGEVIGVNSHDQLAEAEATLRRRINHTLMREGVWMLDPDRTYVDATVTVEPGARLYPGTHLEGRSVVGAGAIVGPDTLCQDSAIGAGAHVMYSVLRSSTVGEEALVGPYASLRPGSVLAARAKAGTFVETKNTTIGEGAKVPHLSYMGDAEVGAGANVGAGTITCNYDGVDKHPTVIGERAFIGSDTMLVAPVTVGDDAVTAAGSVITEDVAPGDLAIERSSQKAVPGYSARLAARKKRRDSEARGNERT